MPSRRQIRETAVQFLYATDLEGSDAVESIRETFWDLTQEEDREKLIKATAKTLLHWAQGREGRIAEWQKRLPNAETRIKSYEEAESLNKLLTQISHSESQWTACIERIKRLRNENSSSTIEELRKEMSELHKANKSLSALRSQFQQEIHDFPKLAGPLEPIIATMNRLERISERLKMLQAPAAESEQAELAHLQKPAKELSSLREQVDTYTKNISEHKEQIDEQIAACVDNYTPERIDPLSRSILRLSVFELLKKPDTPKPVIINEGVEIAKRFGNSDSSKFINGVLDKVAKKQEDSLGI